MGGAIAWIAVCAPWFNIPRDQADSAGMLAHLHAYFVDADLLYDDEYRRLDMSPLFAFVTREGVVSNHWPAGATWLQLPGYALGRTAARVLSAFGVGSDSALGVVPVLGVRAWACLGLGCIAAVVGRVAARAAGGRSAVGAAVATVFVVGSPLLYYAVEAPLRPHLWGAGAVLALVWVWMRPELAGDTPVARTLVLALLAGLATAVRPQLAPLSLLVVHDAWSGRREGPRDGRRYRRQWLWGAVGLAAWPLLHARTQLWMYGWGLTDYAGAVTVHLRQFVFSPHHGALSWCPVLAIVGWTVVQAAWKGERGGVLIALLLAHQIWLDATMRPIAVESVLGTRTWAGGTGFAARKLVDVLPLALPAIQSLVARGARARWGPLLLGAALVASVPTALLHAAAFVSPEATTGAVIDSYPALFEVMRLPLSGAGWSSACAARALPLAVPLVVTATVTVPLSLAAWRVRGVLAHTTAAVRVRLAGTALVLGAVVAHAWLSVLQVRSDAALLASPERMTHAAATLDPRHRATVRLLPQHHAQLRAALGDDAAP